MSVKLAKLRVDHDFIRVLLGLPDDTRVTSIYTKRRRHHLPRDQHSWIYITSERFNELGEWEEAPEISLRDAKNNGMWDEEENEQI